MQKKMEEKQSKQNEQIESHTNSKDERTKEKVVYKVVPVPYYYPVPVDAEWYYKHYEPPMRNGERGFHGYPEDHALEHLPFHPPPVHGFPGPRSALRESYYYASSRDEDERYLRPVSPLYRHLSPSRSNNYSSPSPGERKTKESKNDENTNEKENKKENGVEEDEDNPSPRSASVKSEPNESDHEESKQNGDLNGSQSDGNASDRSDKEDENGGDNKSNSDSEVARKRKRFPMTFPYDQRKKNLKDGVVMEKSNTEKEPEDTNGRVEESQQQSPKDYKRSRSDEPSAPRVYSSHKYSNGSSPNGHYPYVMVPIRSPPYGDVGRSPRYTERSHSYYESRMYDDTYVKSGNPGADRKDDKREIRYHPNGRRARTVFTRQQLLTLNNVFEKHPFVSGERMSELSDQLGLDRKIVKIWFQNKRQYARKKGSLVERGGEEYYYDYQDRFNPASVPPTMAERWKVES